MKIIFSPTAMEHFEFWKKTNPRVADRIKVLLRDISEHPFTGIGKPEPLKGNLQGLWSRRISSEHRIIYEVFGSDIIVHILSMKYHYRK